MSINDPDAQRPKPKPSAGKGGWSGGAPPKPPRAPTGPVGALSGTGYEDAAWESALQSVGIAPNYMEPALNFLTMYGGKASSPWATGTWLATTLKEFEDNPAHMAFYGKYGNDYLEIVLDAVMNGGDDPNYLKNRLAAAGMSAVGLKLPGSGSRGGRGGGGGGGGATKEQQYAAAEAAIRNQAGVLGYADFKEEHIKALAKTVVDGNWSGEQLTDYLVTGATGNWGTLTGGQLKAGVDAAKALAAKQLVTISDTTAQDWARRMATGEMDMDGLHNLIQEQATARYGWAADVIKKGITMADFLAPSRDRIAQELEVPPEQIDLYDPKVQSMVTVTDEKGVTRAATDSELIRQARADERWKSTKNARATAASAAVMLRQYVEGR